MLYQYINMNILVYDHTNIYTDIHRHTQNITSAMSSTSNFTSKAISMSCSGKTASLEVELKPKPHRAPVKQVRSSLVLKDTQTYFLTQ